MGDKHSTHAENKRTSRFLHRVTATAHAYTDASVLHAINNGVRGIEHGNLISEETVKMYVLHFSGDCGYAASACQIDAWRTAW